MLEALVGGAADIYAAVEPPSRDGSALRCERRGAEIDQHFGYYVMCGRSAPKAFKQLKKQMKRLARKRRGYAWKSAFEAPGTFAFLSQRKGCYAQVAGRLLLARPDLGERLGSVLAQNLHQ